MLCSNFNGRLILLPFSGQIEDRQIKSFYRRFYMSRRNRSYDKEFKLNAVQLCKNSGKSAAKIAEDLGIPKQTFYQWVKDYEEDGEEGFRGKGNIRPSNEELYFLKKELADVKMERDILKKVIAIFSK